MPKGFRPKVTLRLGHVAPATKLNKSRVTAFIKKKFKISDDQTNIDKYRLAANITEDHIISKLFLQ